MSSSGRQRGTGRKRGASGLRWWALCLAVGLASFLQTGTGLAQFSGPNARPSPSTNIPLQPTTDPAILYPGPREIKLDAGDVIVVHVYGPTDYAPTTRVSLDGAIQLPLIGVVQVAGLTIHEAERLIAERLQSAGMYRDPQVTIQLTESPNQIITVVGEAHGVVTVLGGNRHLLDVISSAGGFTGTASHMVAINRPGLDQPIVVDLGTDPTRSALANVPVFPHDTIIVPRIGTIYLLGAFKTQGAIPLQQNSPMTLMQAAALGNGPGWEGRFDDVRIVRSVGLERKVLRVDIDKVMKGKEADPVLQADDIVFLPSSGMKSAIKNGGISTLLGIVSILFVAIQTTR